MHQLETGGGMGADARGFQQAFRGLLQGTDNGAEVVQAGLGDGFGIDPRDGIGQQQFQQLIVGQCVAAGLEEALPQAAAVTGGSGVFVGCRFHPWRHRDGLNGSLSMRVPSPATAGSRIGPETVENLKKTSGWNGVNKPETGAKVKQADCESQSHRM